MDLQRTLGKNCKNGSLTIPFNSEMIFNSEVILPSCLREELSVLIDNFNFQAIVIKLNNHGLARQNQADFFDQSNFLE